VLCCIVTILDVLLQYNTVPAHKFQQATISFARSPICLLFLSVPTAQRILAKHSEEGTAL
jgi:hypothetical protein